MISSLGWTVADATQPSSYETYFGRPPGNTRTDQVPLNCPVSWNDERIGIPSSGSADDAKSGVRLIFVDGYRAGDVTTACRCQRHESHCDIGRAVQPTSWSMSSRTRCLPEHGVSLDRTRLPRRRDGVCFQGGMGPAHSGQAAKPALGGSR
jgi:hypothetical protein